MPPVPKPTKGAIKREKKQVRDDLQQYRIAQRLLAVDRDNGQCVFCWFLNNKVEPAVDVHHVFGRARTANDYRERYTNLVCTCRECHPGPINFYTLTTQQTYILTVTEMANSVPINGNFKIDDQPFMRVID